MPGFVTHYLFGTDTYKKLPSGSLKKSIRKNHAAFSLGLQGPDIFFYYMPSFLYHGTNLGALAHSKDTGSFFSYLLESRTLFPSGSGEQAVADAYLAGFIGHYTSDCVIHPYIYAFTGYKTHMMTDDPAYFGQHAYFETELDNVLLYKTKHLYPSRFHPNATLTVTAAQRRVISKMLSYAYKNTFPSITVTSRQVRSAIFWMKITAHLLMDPTGQKKVLIRLTERLFLKKPFISGMLASDHYRFVPDPMNHSRRSWTHPWTGTHSRQTFMDLYRQAQTQYLSRLLRYQSMMKSGFLSDDQKKFALEYGNNSFLSGQPIH